MQLPNLLLPDQAGENNRRLCYPGHRLDDVIVNPIARLKPYTVAIENIGKLAETKISKSEEEKLEEVDYISANDKSKNSDFIKSRGIATGHMSEGEATDEELEEDFDLSSILRELNDEDDSVNEAKEDEEKDKIKDGHHNRVLPLELGQASESRILKVWGRSNLATPES